MLFATPSGTLPAFDLATYYPVFVYFIAIVGFAVTSLVMTHLIGPKHDTRIKLMTYESGMDPIGDARLPDRGDRDRPGPLPGGDMGRGRAGVQLDGSLSE